MGIDQFAEWDRFMECVERRKTGDEAFKLYKKEKDQEELNRYKRDLARGDGPKVRKQPKKA